ncbi:MAG: hypothetical protein VYC20_05755 [Pseudomonadota bacterium]|nr:hypothetical protein [Pseudomonadota bacterium]
MSTPSPFATVRLSSRRLKIRFAALLVAMLGVFVAPAHAETMQQGWVGDLPIMHGMRIEPELGFAFDSPGGRIVLVFAATTSDRQDVLAYYNGALMSLGWSGGDGNWVRGDESLGLAQVDTSVGRLWRIRLSPR